VLKGTFATDELVLLSHHDTQAIPQPHTIVVYGTTELFGDSELRK